MSWRRSLFTVCLASTCLLVIGGWALAASPAESPPATLAMGGQLYDKWWTAAGVAEPQGNHPLWATQTTNTRKGLDTWRCKECHGWDYKGKDGAYGSGSHKTGFVGVVDASKTRTQEEIVAILKGSSNPDHNFATFLDDASINALAAFVKEGVVPDLTQYIDYATKKPKGADASRGAQFIANSCALCHGADGTRLNFGSSAAPEYVGTIAADNPQEFLHKVQFGQPGALMPSGVQNGWSLQDALDVLASAQTLPTGKPAPAAAPAPDAAPSAARGGQVYQDNCATCHGKQGEGNLGIPNLAGAAGHVQQLGIAPEQAGPGIVKLLRDGINGNMPPFPASVLGDKDISDLGAYLFTLPPTTGANIYNANCALCHGTQGEGTVGPALAGAPEKFAKLGLSKAQVLAGFPDLVRKGIPGKMPANPQLTDGEIASMGEHVWELGKWEAEFQASHGRAPTAADRADREWSLQFAEQTGRDPTEQDWITHHIQSRG